MSVIPTATTPIGMLGPQEWIDLPSTQQVFQALQAQGSEVRFVGGCVRDSLSKRAVVDIDIATPDQPETVMTLLESAGIKVIPTGIKHGTVTAIVDGRTFEITTLRRDVETDGRYARVVFTDDWVEDAKRRDFTINSMSANLDGDVYDPFSGISDLAHGYIRFVGLAQERVEEDVLRILRYFRFFGTHGRPPADRHALAACRVSGEKLTTLSGERICSEFRKILMCPDPASVCLMMRSEHVLKYVLPEATDIGRLRVLSWLETRAFSSDHIQPDWIRRLVSILDATPDQTKAISQQLRLSNSETKQLLTLCQPDQVTPYMTEREEIITLRKYGAERTRDLILLRWAAEGAINPNLSSDYKQGWINFLERCDNWLRPELPVGGKDVQQFGIPEGSLVGDILTQLEQWWEAESCKPTREDCLEKLRQLVREV